MIIFLYGPDDYRRLQKKRELVAEFRKKHSALGMETFDLAQKDWFDSFEGFARGGSLFESAKLAIFENTFELEAKQLAKILAPFIADKATTLLIVERDKPVKAISFLLEKPVISQKFENLEGADWMHFLAAEAKKNGMTLAPAAAQFLADVYQGNSWALATELQKLGSLKMDGSASSAATKTVIEKKDLDTFNLEAAPNYWALLNGAKSYDLKTRLYALEKLLATNDPPAKLFNILASQWKEKIPQFAEFDFGIKSGKLEYEEALLDLALS